MKITFDPEITSEMPSEDSFEDFEDHYKRAVTHAMVGLYHEFMRLSDRMIEGIDLQSKDHKDGCIVADPNAFNIMGIGLTKGYKRVTAEFDNMSLKIMGTMNDTFRDLAKQVYLKGLSFGYLYIRHGIIGCPEDIDPKNVIKDVKEKVTIASIIIGEDQ